MLRAAFEAQEAQEAQEAPSALDPNLIIKETKGMQLKSPTPSQFSRVFILKTAKDCVKRLTNNSNAIQELEVACLKTSKVLPNLNRKSPLNPVLNNKITDLNKMRDSKLKEIEKIQHETAHMFRSLCSYNYDSQIQKGLDIIQKIDCKTTVITVELLSDITELLAEESLIRKTQLAEIKKITEKSYVLLNTLPSIPKLTYKKTPIEIDTITKSQRISRFLKKTIRLLNLKVKR